jgi:hypothetical protein
MAGKKAAVNQAAKKAASDGKVTQKEAAKVQQAANNAGVNNAAVAIARAAANNQAQIAQSVQSQLGITQNKNLTKASVTPQANIYGSGAPGGMDAYVSGFTNQQGSSANQQQVPIYTFTSRNGSTAKTTKPAATTTPAETQPAEQKPMNNQTEQWSDSVDNGMSELEAILKTQMEANAAQTELYMGMMQDMMSQMQMANQQQQQATPQGAYAVTTYQTPATGAQTTKEIAPRKPVANDSLSISSLPAAASGVGLNLAI